MVDAGHKSSGSFWHDTIPQAWAEPKLRYLASIRNGSDYKDFQVDDGGYPVFGSGGEFARTSRFLHDGESVLLGRKGTVDKPLYVNGRFWAVDTMFYTSIGRRISAKYLHYFATTIPYDYFQTTTAVPSMTQGDLGSIKVPLPSLAKQQRIVAFLDRETAQINELIGKQERLVELLAEKRQGIITHAVTKGLNTASSTKDSGVAWQGPVPDHWSVEPLKNMIRMQTGVTLGKDFSDENTEPYSYLRVANVQIGYVDLTNVKEINLPPSLAAASMLQPGDVLMTEGGDRDKLARGCIWDAPIVPCVHQNHIFAVRTSERLLNEFLVMTLDADPARTYFYVTGKQSTNLASTNSTTVKNFRFGVPPVHEQRQIVEYLKKKTLQIDDLRDKAKSVIAMLKERRSALISAAVTGKIDVSEGAV